MISTVPLSFFAMSFERLETGIEAAASRAIAWDERGEDQGTEDVVDWQHHC